MGAGKGKVSKDQEPRRIPGAARDLDSLFAAVAALRELAADTSKKQDSARVYDFSIRWGTMLAGRLERLAHYHGRGELRPRERERYERLRTELRDALPAMRELGLARPAVPLK